MAVNAVTVITVLAVFLLWHGMEANKFIFIVFALLLGFMVETKIQISRLRKRQETLISLLYMESDTGTESTTAKTSTL
jgi:hypothetical protein